MTYVWDVVFGVKMGLRVELELWGREWEALLSVGA